MSGHQTRRVSRHRQLSLTLLSGAGLFALCCAAQAADQPASTPGGIEEVVVTAEKHEEAINRVPMSITAVSGSDLQQRGIDGLQSLAAVVPGFNYTESKVGTPIYTLRGLGFSDIAMGGRPTVSVYADEAPIPFTIETRGGNFDLDHVEVLKGPQGTLFGQNATGGAINLIANKPTDTFEAGLDAGFGNYDATLIGGFVSGPIDDTLNGRIAVQHSQSDGWQKSYTTGQTNGATNLTNGRLLLDWAPTSRLKVSLNLNGFIDKSESQAPQLNAISPEVPAAAPLIPGLLGYPIAPRRATAADWNPDMSYRRDNTFFQGNLRVDYDLSDTLKLTSLTSYSHYKENQPQDIDGTTLADLQQITTGKIKSWSEELRVSGEFLDNGYFVLGGNYASDRVNETDYDDLHQSTQAYLFTALGLPLFNDFSIISNQDAQTYAAFGNVEYHLTDAWKIYGGARYTQSNNKFSGCTADSGNGNAASIFGPYQNFVRGLMGLPANPAIPVGGCVTADETFTPGLVHEKLDQSNVSWRVGTGWQVSAGTMLYANVSKGYKAGGFADIGATAASQYIPARQESVLAYEAGFKSNLADDTLQLNGAAFYYNYQDKQVLGSVIDPLFGRLLKLINIPKSRILGAELSATWLPVTGLTLNGSASYIDSKILGNFTNYDPAGNVQDFEGQPFPNTPKWQLIGDATYEWPVWSGWNALVGVNISYQSATNTDLGELPVLAKKAYSLTDLRAGVESTDGAWLTYFWVKNATNTYYWTSSAINIDTINQFAGMPRTYGITLSYRYN